MYRGFAEMAFTVALICKSKGAAPVATAKKYNQRKEKVHEKLNFIRQGFF